MQEVKPVPGWWDAVVEIAGLVSQGYDFRRDERQIRTQLGAKGFGGEAVGRAVDWIEGAAASAGLSEVFGMFQPESPGLRLRHPVEALYLSDELWRDLQRWQRQGLISAHLVETLLEGLRAVDSRDWDDEDIRSFVAEMITSTYPYPSPAIAQYIRGKRVAYRS